MIGILAAVANSVRAIILYAKDGFDRANGPLGSPEYGAPWSVGYGTVSIVSNKAKGGTAGANGAFLQTLGKKDYLVSADFVWNSTETVSLIARSASTADDNHMRLRYDGTKLTIFRKISGTQVTLAEYAYAWTSGSMHNLGLACAGNTFRAYIDGALVITLTDDNATKSNIYAGFAIYKPTIPAGTADNFRVEA